MNNREMSLFFQLQETLLPNGTCTINKNEKIPIKYFIIFHFPIPVSIFVSNFNTAL